MDKDYFRKCYRGDVKNAQLCFGQEAQAVMQESEEQDKELVAGYTLEEAEEKEAREEAERIAAEEAARKAEEEAAKKKQALSSVGTTYGSVDASDEEVWLLACIIDWEAGSESYEGKLAVANVVLNRVKSGKWGSSITSVVYAPKQFSGVSDGKRQSIRKICSQIVKRSEPGMYPGSKGSFVRCEQCRKLYIFPFAFHCKLFIL